MSSNPYGASCGSSTVIPPRLVRVSLGKLGTPSMRLSDTASGKSPKRPRTREEVEAMQRHPAGKQITVIRKAQPACTCKECLTDNELLAGMEQDSADLLAIIHARIERNNQEDSNSKAQAQARSALYLAARGEMDS